MTVKSTKVNLKRISALFAQKGLVIVENVENMKNVITLLQRKNLTSHYEWQQAKKCFPTLLNSLDQWTHKEHKQEPWLGLGLLTPSKGKKSFMDACIQQTSRIPKEKFGFGSRGKFDW